MQSGQAERLAPTHTVGVLGPVACGLDADRRAATPVSRGTKCGRSRSPQPSGDLLSALLVIHMAGVVGALAVNSCTSSRLSGFKRPDLGGSLRRGVQLAESGPFASTRLGPASSTLSQLALGRSDASRMMRAPTTYTVSQASGSSVGTSPL